MPATAGRVRMPANNRVHSSAALQTHGIWQSAIGYDPYAPNKEDKKDSSQNLPNAEPDAENAYASFQGLLQLAKITNADVDVSRGACKKCGRVGHLKFQCKNYVKIKDDNEEKDPDAMQPVGLVGLDKKLKVEKLDRRSNVESSEEEEDSDSSDSEIDSEIERIIAERSGKKISRKRSSSNKKGNSDGDGSDKDSDQRRKRGRSKKRSSKRKVSDSDDSDEEKRRRRRKRRREHRRKREKSSDEDDEYRRRQRKSRKEKRRRRSHLSDSDSSEDSIVRHKRKSKRASSSSEIDSSGHNDSRKGRHVNKSEKRRSRHHGGDE
ncbi:CAX-interacting protein 4 [Vigna radiata var. radiata]|uniref:CAX-interacting protein 4 n=1 Tax=Vigna radiata var. radiata TaxID=3916 RepID=A0A1S3V1P3_VIGRR|nr:CAX-interacting protein 4 [Vigna radiata var. radiata]